PQFERVFGPLGPLSTSWPYFVAVSAPTISAVVVSAAFGGLKGVRSLFAGLIRPFRLLWLIVASLAAPTAYVSWGLIERLIPGTGPRAIDISAILVAPLLWFTTARIFLDPGPWGEETGWRGFALPRLLKLFSPLSAALMLGAIWGIWHTPALFAEGLSQFGLNFAWFLLVTICLSILMTWIYVNANGNYFIAGVIPHAVNNLLGFRAFHEIRVEALVYAGLVLLIIACFGPTLKGWRRSSQSIAAAA
ncbi:MAG TPA: CPBP family intramembrane glutamic endopeptidase, partial [Candidatus Acidoferrales bacterium]